MFKKASLCKWIPFRGRCVRGGKKLFRKLERERLEKEKEPIYCTGSRKKTILRKKS